MNKRRESMLTQSAIWEADTKDLEMLLNEVKRELNFRAICESKPMPYTLELDTPLAEVYGG
jgi:hypothetical protein